MPQSAPCGSAFGDRSPSFLIQIWQARRAMRSRAIAIPILLWASACATTPVKVETRVPTLAGPISDLARNVAGAARPSEKDAYREGAWDPAYFDRLLPSDALEISGFPIRHRREGVGVPMVGVRETLADDPFYYPPEGIIRPLTATVVHAADGGASVRLLDSSRESVVRIDEALQPLAADFTAAYAVLLSRTRLERTALTGAFDHEKIGAHAGIFLLEPYDADRIPLLLVHGLISSPLTWMELTNELFGDAAIRARYQIWHAVYPTGIPFLHAAADFRAQLGRLRRALDPEDDDFATNHIVVVAHSKGGLLTKTLVSASGDQLWYSAFTVPPQDLEASPEDLLAMREFLFFDRNAAVRRVVFIATPHRGSRLADNPLARFVASWISLPRSESETFERVLRANEAYLAPDFRFRLAGLPSGPRALSTRDPLIRALGELPVDPAVPFHTILGELEPGTQSDGVVGHASSRQAGAASELVVAGEGHGVHRSPIAIEEVMRILLEHAESYSAWFSRGIP